MEPATFAKARAVEVYYQLREIRNRTEAPRDCSSGFLAARFRAWKYPPGASTTAAANVLLDATTNPDGTDGGGVDPGETGWFRGVVEFSEAIGQVVCEVVLIDLAVADATTPSGSREYLWGRQWTATVADSLGA